MFVVDKDFYREKCEIGERLLGCGLMDFEPRKTQNYRKKLWVPFRNNVRT